MTTQQRGTERFKLMGAGTEPPARLVVHTWANDSPVDYDYILREDADGVLWWDYVENMGKRWGEVCRGARIVHAKLKRKSQKMVLDGSDVTPEDAQDVTGLDHPMAAMDRLREMLYEVPVL